VDLASLARHFWLSPIRDTVVRSFVKCGIASPTSGQRDSEINLSGLENYTIGQLSDMEQIWFHDDE